MTRLWLSAPLGSIGVERMPLSRVDHGVLMFSGLFGSVQSQALLVCRHYDGCTSVLDDKSMADYNAERIVVTVATLGLVPLSHVPGA